MNDASSICILCRKRAARIEKIPDVSAHRVDCTGCGIYEIGTGTTMLYSRSVRDEASIASQIRQVKAANSKGLVLVVPDGRRIANHPWLPGHRVDTLDTSTN